jgi:DNA-binding CsgD family transcriptional regulator
MSCISNEEELVQNLWVKGKTPDEIAGILEIDVKQVHEYLDQGR